MSTTTDNPTISHSGELLFMCKCAGTCPRCKARGSNQYHIGDRDVSVDEIRQFKLNNQPKSRSLSKGISIFNDIYADFDSDGDNNNDADTTDVHNLVHTKRNLNRETHRLLFMCRCACLCDRCRKRGSNHYYADDKDVTDLEVEYWINLDEEHTRKQREREERRKNEPEPQEPEPEPKPRSKIYDENTTLLIRAFNDLQPWGGSNCGCRGYCNACKMRLVLQNEFITSNGDALMQIPEIAEQLTGLYRPLFTQRNTQRNTQRTRLTDEIRC
jgi:hypothetical protein